MIQTLSCTCPQEKGKGRTSQPEHHHFIMVPYFLFDDISYKEGETDIELSPHYLKAFLRFLRKCGGHFTGSLCALARKLGMAKATVMRAIDAWVKCNLVTKEGNVHIDVCDLWQMNYASYPSKEEASSISPTVSQRNTAVSQRNTAVSQRNSRAFDETAPDVPSEALSDPTIDSLLIDVLVEDSLYVLRSYVRGYEGQTFPVTHNNETVSHIVNMTTGSEYPEEEQAIDESNDAQNEVAQEEKKLSTFFADRSGICEDEHDEEESPVEQMSTDVDKQASTVDKDKPSNRDVAQETEGTHGHLSSQHHSGVVGPQHDLAHHPGDDTRSSAQAVSAAELIAAEARAVYPMPEMQKPAILGDRQRAACATNIPTNPTSDNETVKGNGNQKHIPVQSQKVGNRGKKAVIPEPTAEAKVVIERWQAVFWQLFKKRILVTPQIIEAAELLAPLDLSVDELIDLRAFCFRANPTWYKDKGLCLMDCYKNVEKWRSLQGDTGETRLSSFDDPNYRVEDEFYPDHHERSAHYAACS